MNRLQENERDGRGGVRVVREKRRAACPPYYGRSIPVSLILFSSVL
jgi:hypothetical protein